MTRRMRLVIAFGSLAELRLKARTLIIGVVELGEGVRELHACAAQRALPLLA